MSLYKIFPVVVKLGTYKKFTTKLLVFSGIESYPTSIQEQAWRLATALEPRRL